MDSTKQKKLPTLFIFFPSKTGGVAEVCYSLKHAFSLLGYKVILVTSFSLAILVSIQQLFSKDENYLISNLQYGIFGFFFKKSIFIIHGLPQRGYEPNIKYAYVRIGHKIFAKINSRTVSVSYFLKYTTKNFYNINSNRVIHNILPHDFFDFLKNTTAKEKQKNSLVYLGRVEQVKGVDRILQAAELLRKNNQPVVVNILGGGSFLETLKNEYNHPDNIFHGYVSSSFKYEILSQSVSFISLHEAEPFGITALEASKLGVGLCLASVGGHFEFVPFSYIFPINNVFDIGEIAKSIQLSFIAKNEKSNVDPYSFSQIDANEYFSNYAMQYESVFDSI